MPASHFESAFLSHFQVPLVQVESPFGSHVPVCSLHVEFASHVCLRTQLPASHFESTLSSHFQVPSVHGVVLGGFKGSSSGEIESAQPAARSAVAASEIQ